MDWLLGNEAEQAGAAPGRGHGLEWVEVLG